MLSYRQYQNNLIALFVIAFDKELTVIRESEEAGVISSDVAKQESEELMQRFRKNLDYYGDPKKYAKALGYDFNKIAAKITKVTSDN